MRKIMIIDDEMLVRVGLKSCIEWEKHGYTIAAMAENASEGLALMQCVRPDIIITDICMPGMDGLAFIEDVKARYPETKIVVLSCYNELEYVKRAMKLGAEDYILKLSIEPEKLLDIIKRLDMDQHRISMVAQQTQERISIGNENLMLLRESLLQRFLTSDLAEENFICDMKRIDQRWPSERPVLIYSGMNQYSTVMDRCEIRVKPLLKYSCINILEELMQGLGGGVAFEWQERYYLLATKTANVQMTIDFCHRANRIISQHLNLSFSWGISSVNSEKSIRSLFQECRDAYAHCFYFQNESIIAYDDTSIHAFRETDYDIDVNLPEISCAVMQDYAKKILEVLDIYIKLHVHPDIVKKTMLRIAYELAAAGRKKAATAGIDWKPQDDPYDYLPNVDTIWQIQDYFQRTLSDLNDKLSASGLRERQEIHQAKMYVEQHVHEYITLDQVAQVCNMSRSYFSSLFKKETGEGLNDYINRRKMERARDLMLHRRMKAYEAAYAIGLNDESYFSKLFKKHMGVSPKKLKTNESTEK